jgi:type III secretion protein Q
MSPGSFAARPGTGDGFQRAVPLPFELPVLSRGFAALTPGARDAGARAADAAAAALASVLDRAVSVRARATPGLPVARAAAARLALDLAAVPAPAVIEVEPALVVALVDALAGGTGARREATALTPIEASALELLGLVALDGACSIPEVEGALAPRLSRGAVEPASALAIELEIAAGEASGRGRLLLPAPAVRALQDRPRCTAAAGAVRLPVSVRSGRAPLTPEEHGALAPGDVVLLDAPGEGDDALVLPGGARFGGTLGADGFHVEEIAMTERNAQLTVLLEVELARVEVPLGELARLEPGAALPLAIDRRGLVTLRVGERAVGRGELVDVDGAVGVRVVSLEVTP